MTESAVPPATTARSAASASRSPATAAGSGNVQSVTRAFRVLDVLAEAGTPLQLAEVAAGAGLAVPTTHRLLRTLLEAGAARQLESRAYALGPRLIGLGERATPPLAESARGVLVRLEDAAQETANLAILDGDLVAYIAQVPSRHRMRMFTEVGRRVLPHASGVGKAMLATLPERRVRDILDRTGLPEYTPTTLTTPEALIADLREGRRRGFAIDDGEQEVGVRCIAVAVPGAVPPAALSISGPAARMTDAIVARAVTELTSAARELAASSE